MFLCIAGNVETDKILKMVKNSVKESAPLEIERVKPQEPDTVLKPVVEQSLAVAQPMFCFGYKLPAFKQITVKQRICTEILLEMIAGDCSPLYKKLMDDGLINDDFSFEHFWGDGYNSVIFEGESSNPKAVAEAIKAEVTRLGEEGINKKLFAAIHRGLYGGAIRGFNSVQSIAMQMVDCAMNDTCLFDEIKYLKAITADDVVKRLADLDNDRTVLSIINPLSEE
jgi:predicted Zn-dependent peptidase